MPELPAGTGRMKLALQVVWMMLLGRSHPISSKPGILKDKSKCVRGPWWLCCPCQPMCVAYAVGLLTGVSHSPHGTVLLIEEPGTSKP